MSDSTRLIQDADRGERAEKVLAETRSILDELDKNVIEEWRECSIFDKEAQTECLVMTRVIADFRDELERRIQDGNYARQQLKEMREDDES